MSRAVKDLVEKQLKNRYATLDSMLVVNVHGLSGIQANDLRRQLREKKIEMHVVKNSLVRRALAGTALEPISKKLDGPCAFVTCDDGPVTAAKELMRLAKEFPTLELKTGQVDGDPDVLTIEQISNRRSKAELQGEVVMLMLSPARRVAGCLKIGGKLAGCVKAIVDKLEKGEAISKVA